MMVRSVDTAIAGLLAYVLGTASALAETTLLLCEGTILVPEWSQIALKSSGTIEVDLPGRMVTGMAGVGGRITELTDQKIVFESQYRRSATYRTEDNGKPIYVYGELDRVSGKLWAQQTRLYRSLADTRDYVRHELVCRPAKRMF